MIQIGVPAVEPLVASVKVVAKSQRWMSRGLVGEILGETLRKIGYEPSIDYLMNLLKDDDSHVRYTAVKVLRTLGNSRAVDSLTGLLNDIDEDVRAAANEALKKIGKP